MIKVVKKSELGDTFTSKMTVNELSDVEVDTISLVKGPANMTPVKVIKSDGEKMSKEQIKPSFEDGVTIYSVTISKADGNTDLDIFGIDENTKTEVIKKDGEVLTKYHLSKADEETIDVPLSNGVSVEVSKVLMDFGSQDGLDYFAKFAANGVMYNIDGALYDVFDMIYKAMDASPAGEVPIQEVSDIMDALKKYVLLQVSILPNEVFKMDKQEIATEEKVDEEKVDEIEVAKSDDAVDEVEETTDSTEAEVSKSDESEEKTEDGKTGEVSKSDDLEKLACDVDKLTEAVAGLTQLIKADKETEQKEEVSKVDTLMKEVESLKSKLEKADKTVPADVDAEAETEVTKSDTKGSIWSGLL